MKFSKLLSRIILILFIFLCTLAFASALWYSRKYGDTGFMSIISTFLSPWTGCANSLKSSYLTYALLPAIFVTGILSFLLFYNGKALLTIKEKQIYPFPEKWGTWIGVVVGVICITIAACSVHFPTYVYDTFMTHSTLYEEEYVDPESVSVSFPEKKRNLVYI